VAGVTFQASVEVLNTSSVPQEKHLELHVDGVRQAVGPTLSLPPGGAVRHEFRFALDRAGTHQGEVRLAEDDGSPLDNRLFFALAVDQQIPVAIVKPRREEIAYVEDSFYLERALGQEASGGGAIRATALTPAELATERLSSYALIFCVDLPALDPAVAERLLQYAKTGGHLFWICGQNVQAEVYNRMNMLAGGQLLPAPLENLRSPAPGSAENWHIGFLDNEHPALAPLTEPVSLYQTVLVYKHFPLTWSAPSEAHALARLDDGQVLLAERAIGSGSTLLLGTGVHVDWTNLPLKPLFLPLFARLTFHLAGASSDHAQVLAGAPLVIPLPEGQSQAVDVDVVRPSGEIARVRNEDRNARSFRYEDTHEAGVYQVRLANRERPRTFAFAVNIDSAESDPATLTHEELERRFGRQPLIFCEDIANLSASIRRLREGKSLWEWFLAAVLVGLVLEAYVANRTNVQTTQQAPPRQVARTRRVEVAPAEDFVVDIQKM
jgi:hypothetical protein